jgi:hypothetical protein
MGDDDSSWRDVIDGLDLGIGSPWRIVDRNWGGGRGLIMRVDVNEWNMPLNAD